MDREKIKVVLGIFLAVMTFGCCLAYVHKENKKKAADPAPTAEVVKDKGKASNWDWNDGWQPGQSPTTPKINGQPIPPEGKTIPVKPQIMANTYKEAISASSREGKPVLVFYTATWCTWCQKMKAETLSDSKVSDLMKNYVYVVVDVDQDRETTRKFGVKEIPAFVITNSTEQKLKFGNKYMSASEFASWLDNPGMFNQPKSETNPVPPDSLPKENPKDMRRPPLIDRRQPQPRS